MVGKWGVDGVNENSECLGDACAESELFFDNSFFSLT